MQSPKLSVVVPVYKTEKFLKRCINSILEQTYNNIELILVDDCSPDGSFDIIRDFVSSDRRVKCVRHKKNRGLFQARISGAEQATGEYISFVDSDDYISEDLYRAMISKALKSDSDMVLCDFVLEYENGEKEFFNADPIRLKNLDLRGEEILDAFMEQQGSFYSWHLAWNKVYKKSLWDKAYPEYKAFSEKMGHLIMTEDIAYSCVSWSLAEHVSNIHIGRYYYCQNSNQSVKNDKSHDKFEKNMNDVLAVFDFFEEILKKYGNYDKYSKDFCEWKKYYGRIYFGIYNDLPSNEGHPFPKEKFGMDKYQWPLNDDNYFHAFKTKCSPSFIWLENIKLRITSPDTKIVSFDIFDTLVSRPFFYPGDLLYLLNEDFLRMTGCSSYIDFSRIRMQCETKCRDEKWVSFKKCVEVTLDEIYDVIERDYGFDRTMLNSLKEREKQLEVKYCKTREIGKELYELALYCGKRVIIVSDIYLPRQTVEQILEKNGYNAHEKLFLSSEEMVMKSDGRLFENVARQLGVSNCSSILHIGDTWNSDVDNAKKSCWSSEFISKDIEIFCNMNEGIWGGNAYDDVYKASIDTHDSSDAMASWGYVGLRSMIALISHRFFDNPFVDINKQTDFNMNPVCIGYYALGFHVLAICRWLVDNIKDKGYKTIHFVARDGYLIQKAYDILTKDMEGLPKSNYLYLSRKALATADINSRTDLFSLSDKIHLQNATPKLIFRVLSPILKDEVNNNAEVICNELKFPYNASFGSVAAGEKFIKLLSDNYISDEDFMRGKDKLRSYFSAIISPNDVLFDIGYSGRAEATLKSLLGYSLTSFYVHANTEKLNERSKYFGFNNHLLYNYKPFVTGVMREHFMMKHAPSVIGFDLSKETVEPVFEEYKTTYKSEFITEMVQKSALEFISDFKNTFTDDMDRLYFRYDDASAIYEYFMNYSKKLDRSIFYPVIFEDDMGSGEKTRAVDSWNESIKRAIDSRFNPDYNVCVVTPEEKIAIDNDVEVLVPQTDSYKERFVGYFSDSLSTSYTAETNFEICCKNAGNAIYWSSLKDTLELKTNDNWFMTNGEGFDNTKYKAFITSNLMAITEKSDITYLEKTLSIIGDKPLVPISVGLSADINSKGFAFERKNLRVLERISERCNSIGVTGEFTAEVLSGYGIKNLRIIGEPSAYRFAEQNLKIERDEVLGSVASSFNPFFGKMSLKEKQLLKYLCDNSTQFINLFDENPSIENTNDNLLLRLIAPWLSRQKTFFDTRLWTEEMKKHSFAIGIQYYANIAAIYAGKPAMFICADMLTAELCKHFSLPSIQLGEFDAKLPMSKYYEMADMTGFTSNIGRRYAEYKNFLDENGFKFNTKENNRIIEI